MDKRIEEVAAKALEKMGNDRYRLSLVVAKERNNWRMEQPLW